MNSKKHPKTEQQGSPVFKSALEEAINHFHAYADACSETESRNSLDATLLAYARAFGPNLNFASLTLPSNWKKLITRNELKLHEAIINAALDGSVEGLKGLRHQFDSSVFSPLCEAMKLNCDRATPSAPSPLSR